VTMLSAEIEMITNPMPRYFGTGGADTSIW
jgi:hypothetical protein